MLVNQEKNTGQTRHPVQSVLAPTWLSFWCFFVFFFFFLEDTRRRSESQHPATEATAEQQGPAQEIPRLVAEYIRGEMVFRQSWTFAFFLRVKKENCTTSHSEGKQLYLPESCWWLSKNLKSAVGYEKIRKAELSSETMKRPIIFFLLAMTSSSLSHWWSLGDFPNGRTCCRSQF